MKCGDPKQCEKFKDKRKIQGVSLNSMKPYVTPWNPMKSQRNTKDTPMIRINTP